MLRGPCVEIETNENKQIVGAFHLIRLSRLSHRLGIKGNALAWFDSYLKLKIVNPRNVV